jgi:type VI protein secretion system component Hcp
MQNLIKAKIMKLVRCFLFVLCIFAGAMHSSAQSQIYMRLNDGSVVGESTAQGFAGWTYINAFNAGSTSEVLIGAGGGGGMSPAVTKCFTVSMIQDKAAYFLKSKMYTGSPLTHVQFDFTKSGGNGTVITYYRVLLEDVYVSAIEEATTEGSIVTMNVSFTPQKFRYTYWPQNSAGTVGTPVIFGWDLNVNKSW